MYILKKLISYIRLNVKNRNFVNQYHKVQKAQYLSYEENQSRQLEKLNTLLTHAYQHIPYYRELFNGLDMVENNTIVLQTLDEIQKIPLLTKDIVRLQKEKMYADDSAKRSTYENSSGGSTGKPLTFLQDIQYSM
nr:hypothetical protein [Campylobacterota bacterium]